MKLDVLRRSTRPTIPTTAYTIGCWGTLLRAVISSKTSFAEVLKLHPEQKKVIANMTLFLQFGVQRPTPAGVVPIPKGELRVLLSLIHI